MDFIELINNSHIFIQIASYRDPELLSTIKDCIEKAKYPDLLTFGICWQHSEDDAWDNLDEFKNDKRFTIMDVKWNESKGTCWARHHIQNMWKGEEYTLQLDSHHRFIKNWDEELINIFKSVDSKKPILTSYGGPYDPNVKELTNHPPYKMTGKFEGDIILFFPESIPDYEKLTSPIPARFISGHYYFTYGIHCLECKYDPELYFTGEEIALSVRSFTNGYDLFHPHKTIIWHEYTRKGRTKHWDDFNDKNIKQIEKKWYEYDVTSKNRVRKLLNQLTDDKINLGKYVLGNIRTLEDYEIYSGINFKRSLLHPKTISGLNPPVNDKNFDWVNNFYREYTYNIDIPIYKNIQFIYLGFKSNTDKEIYRIDITNNLQQKIEVSFKSYDNPYKYILWPYYVNSGWGEKTEIFI